MLCKIEFSVSPFLFLWSNFYLKIVFVLLKCFLLIFLFSLMAIETFFNFKLFKKGLVYI